jgi:WD40 repeat protein
MNIKGIAVILIAIFLLVACLPATQAISTETQITTFTLTPVPPLPTHTSTHVSTPTPTPIVLTPITAENASRLERLAQISVANDYGLRDLEFDPSGGKLAVVDSDGKLVIWQFSNTDGSSIMPDDDSLSEISFEQKVSDVAFDPRGTLLAVAGWTLGLALIDIDSGKLVKHILLDFGPQTITYIDNKGRIAIAGKNFDYNIYGPIAEIWDTATGQKVAALNNHPTMDSICSLTTSSDYTILAAGYCDYNMMTWDISGDPETLKRVLGIDSWECYSHCGSPYNEIEFLPNSHILASGTDNIDIPFRNVDNSRLAIVINTSRKVSNDGPYFAADVQDIAFSPDGSIFIISAGTEVQLRDPSTGQFLHHIEYPDGEGYATLIAVNSSNTLLAVGNSNGDIELWGIPIDEK